MTRQEHLNNLVDKVLAAHQDWQETAGDGPPEDGYFKLVTAMLNGFSKGDIPSGHRRLAAAVESLREPARVFNDTDDMGTHTEQQNFYRAIDNLARVRRLPTKADIAPLETVAELMKLPGMSLRQVAIMYRAYLPNGEPDQSKIKRELENPGSEFPVGYNPRIAELEAEDAEIGEVPVFNEADEMSLEKKPCPESPLDLWELDGMTPQQAAKMLCIPVEEVIVMFRKFDKDAKLRKTKQTVAASS